MEHKEGRLPFWFEFPKVDALEGKESKTLYPASWWVLGRLQDTREKMTMQVIETNKSRESLSEPHALTWHTCTATKAKVAMVTETIVMNRWQRTRQEDRYPTGHLHRQKTLRTQLCSTSLYGTLALEVGITPRVRTTLKGTKIKFLPLCHNGDLKELSYRKELHSLHVWVYKLGFIPTSIPQWKEHRI